MTIDKKTKAAATKLFKADESITRLFVNKDGEFFTSENLCKNSVKSDKDYAEIKRDLKVVASDDSGSGDGTDKK